MSHYNKCIYWLTIKCSHQVSIGKNPPDMKMYIKQSIIAIFHVENFSFYLVTSFHITRVHNSRSSKLSKEDMHNGLVLV